MGPNSRGGRRTGAGVRLLCRDRGQMKVEHRQIAERVRPAWRVLVVDERASFRAVASGPKIEQRGAIEFVAKRDLSVARLERRPLE